MASSRKPRTFTVANEDYRRHELFSLVGQLQCHPDNVQMLLEDIHERVTDYDGRLLTLTATEEL